MLLIETHEVIYGLRIIPVRGIRELECFSIAYGEEMMIPVRGMHVEEGDEESGV